MNKKLIFVLTLTLMSMGITSAQTDTIRSIKLDSLIWKKVSDYRKTVGQRPLQEFQNGKLRAFTQMITERNFPKDMQEHSHEAGVRYNAECLFRFQSTGNSKEILKLYEDLKNNNTEFLAIRCVNGWINSPPHNKAITRPENVISSVVAIVVCEQKDNGQLVIRMDVVYHAISDNPDDCSQCYANITE